MIQHVLQKQLGLLSRVAAKKPLLTQAMVKKRLKFYLKYKPQCHVLGRVNI
jgi:hypothetical protein